MGMAGVLGAGGASIAFKAGPNKTDGQSIWPPARIGFWTGPLGRAFKDEGEGGLWLMTGVDREGSINLPPKYPAKPATAYLPHGVVALCESPDTGAGLIPRVTCSVDKLSVRADALTRAIPPTTARISPQLTPPGLCDC